MNVLIVTGKKAQHTVQEAINKTSHKLTYTPILRILDLEVAAFITPKHLLHIMAEFDEIFDLILIPGLITADFSGIENQYHTNVRLGPKNAYDLDIILPQLPGAKLSKTVPACVLLLQVHEHKALLTIRQFESVAGSAFSLNGLNIGKNSLMKVVSEIVDATQMDDESLTERIQYLASQGCDIIDLGCSLDATPAQVTHAVNLAKATKISPITHIQKTKNITSIPISIDTLRPDLIIAALDAGVDLVLSISSNNVDAVGKAIAKKGAAAVVIYEKEAGFDTFIDTIARARRYGIEKIIADPVFDSIGQRLVESTARYSRFRQIDKNTPLFLGAGNVTELIDADSIGVNALCAGIASELGAHILFTTEASTKTQGSTRELARAAAMMKLAQMRDSPPKDLGIDLLVIKEKRGRDDMVIPDVAAIIQAKDELLEYALDPKGCFTIGISRKTGHIIAIYRRSTTIIGKTARNVMDEILRRELVSSISHGAYLGGELMRAELAIRFGRSFMQDGDF